MSPADAAAQLSSIAPDRTLTLHDGSRTFKLAAADLGITVDGTATANKAAEVGRAQGSALQGINAMIAGAQVAPIYTIDLAKADSALKTVSNSVNVAAVGTTPGRTLNTGATLDALPPDLNTLLQTGDMKLVMDVTQSQLATGPRTQYTVQRGEELGLISKKFNVPMNDIMALNNMTDANALYPGQVLIIPAAGVWVPTEKDSPPAPLAKGKAIVVSLLNQRIYAYEDGHLVHSSLMSSGRPGNETVQGDYHIYVKYVTTRMTGPDYDLPNVPWTMYFYAGYGIHGAYWHNDFGRTLSHGCVNLETSEAKWFYDFAPVGTLVRVLPNWTTPGA